MPKCTECGNDCPYCEVKNHPIIKDAAKTATDVYDKVVTFGKDLFKSLTKPNG